MGKKPKVALIEGGLHKVYESGFHILNKISELEIITPAPETVKGIRVKRVRSKSLGPKHFQYYVGLSSYLKKKNFDVVSVRPYYRPFAFTALLYCIFNKKRFVVMEEQRNDPHNFIERLLFNSWLLVLRPLINKYAHAVIGITKPSSDYLKRKGFKNVQTINVPYKPKVAAPQEKSKKIKAICVARFEWLKAHHILVKAISELAHVHGLTHNDIEVNLVGAGSLQAEMEALVKEEGVEHIVHFVGKIPNEKLDAYYRKHNLFLLSSVSEPVGMVVYEAMSNGLPCIVSSATGAKGSVKDGRNGYVFETKDYRDLAHKILKLCDERKRQRFGKESINILKKEHDPKTIQQQYERVFKL